jgi:hypothetical protein
MTLVSNGVSTRPVDQHAETIRPPWLLVDAALAAASAMVSITSCGHSWIKVALLDHAPLRVVMPVAA